MVHPMKSLASMGLTQAHPINAQLYEYGVIWMLWDQSKVSDVMTIIQLSLHTVMCTNNHARATELSVTAKLNSNKYPYPVAKS